MTLMFVYALLAVGVSFICSLLEASLLSVPLSHVKILEEKGLRSGRILHEMKRQIDRPLTAILTLNTIAHTVGAAGVGVQAAEIFGSPAVGIASAIMTLIILVFSEIIPKTLGAVHARRLATTTAYTTHLLILLCLPIIGVLQRINRLIAGKDNSELMSRAELTAAIRLCHQGGTLQRREYSIASNLLGLNHVRLNALMTPRTVLFALPEQMTAEQAIAEHQPIRFSRIPVYGKAIDDITGYVTRSDLYESYSQDRRDTLLKDMAKPIKLMPEQASVADCLQIMLEQRQHIILVVDEYGGTSGIVTLEDAFEELLGEEIVDETDPVVDMQELAKRRR